MMKKDDKILLALLLTTLLLVVLDGVFTTVGVIKGFQEANPLITHLMTDIGMGISQIMVLLTIFKCGLLTTITLDGLHGKVKTTYLNYTLFFINGWLLNTCLTWIGVLWL